jgi:hypothetical protein
MKSDGTVWEARPGEAPMSRRVSDDDLLDRLRSLERFEHDDHSVGGEAANRIAELEAEVEREHIRTLVEARELLAMMCGRRYWKNVADSEATALSQAAQVIVNEFSEHFAVALDSPAQEKPR